jgi:hypothetical protein
VALVALEAQGVLDRLADVALAAVLAHGLDADAGARWDLALAQLAVGWDHHLIEVLDQIEAHRIARFPLDPHVDVFGVFAIDDHIEVLRALVGAGGALVVAAGAHAAIQIKDLAQGHVEGADAAADRCGQGPLDSHAVLLDGAQGVFRQVLVGAVEVAGLVAGVHLEPLDPALTAVGLGHRRVQHFLGGGPDVYPRAITANEGNNRIVGHDRLTVFEANCGAAGRGGELLKAGGARGCHGLLLTCSA